MNISSFNYGLVSTGWKLAPLTRYVMSDSMFRTIVQGLEEQGRKDSVRSWSCFNSYERRYAGQDLNGRRLAIYRENGMGDNLMITGLTAYLRTTYPQATIDVYALPRVAAVWHGNTDVNYFDICPPFDAVANGYDFHLFIEGFIENNNEREQKNAYDDLLAFCGIFPKSVDPKFKRPHVFWTPEDDACEREWAQLRPQGDYIVWHWNPSGRVRQYPFDLSRKAIALLAEKFNVIVVGDTDGGIPGLEMSHPSVYDWLGKTPHIRSFLPMIKHAKAVVCPDSCVLHLAPCFPDVPTVALYGAFSHNDRSLYYPNVTPLYNYDACPSAPCRAQRAEFPIAHCSQARGYVEGEVVCCAMKAITPERIVATVTKLLK